MIDNKKIEDAAKVYMIGEFYDRDEAEWNYPITNEERRNQCIIDFKAGAKWTINEFLKDLWHPASEEPDVRHKTIICLYEDGDIRQDYDVYNEALTHDTFLGIGKFNWNDYAENEEIKKWCYATDLLPKEEGENERT